MDLPDAKSLLSNDVAANVISMTISFVALFVAVIALIYTIRTFWLKAGDKVRFSYTTSSTVYAEDKFVSSFTIENLKDKALVVFSAYLKLGNSVYLTLEEFEDEPLIIHPFEAYQKTLDPVIFYSVNTRRVAIDHLFDAKNIRPKLVLSTTSGKVQTNAYIRRWWLTGEYFRNMATAIVQPRFLIYKGKGYGSRTRYLATVVTSNDSEQVIPIAMGDSGKSIFRSLEVPESELSSKDKLEAYLRSKINDGTVTWKSVEVVDFRSEVETVEGFNNDQPVKLDSYSWLYHHVVGRIVTLWKDVQRKRENRRRAKQHRESSN